jgi:hypothetical protein
MLGMYQAEVESPEGRCSVARSGLGVNSITKIRKIPKDIHDMHRISSSLVYNAILMEGTASPP